MSLDRHLIERNGWFHYNRRVPRIYAEIDPRPFSRASLKTKDRIEARLWRDMIEKHDDERWRAMLAGRSSDGHEAYKATIARAVALGFAYVPRAEMSGVSDEDLVNRLVTLGPGGGDATDRAALLGGAGPPSASLHEALDIIETNVKREMLARKSPRQKIDWRKGRLRGIDSFIAVVGDIPISDITRDQALTFHRFWLNRISPAEGKPQVGPNAGNKAIGSMRAVWAEYHAYMGADGHSNPFRGLRFDERDVGERPPFSESWLRNKLLAPGALDGLNEQARDILLATVNTGARPSEIANLDGERIILDANIPHIDIRSTSERDIKTRSSVRRIPLVGVSLEAMRRHPHGFPRYADKSTHMSNTLMKYLRLNGLLESDRHTVYSLRHSFEERMKRAGIDMELRQYLMGHKLNRPRYGYSEDLSWALAAVEEVGL